jgi:hypothetical protein
MHRTGGIKRPIRLGIVARRLPLDAHQHPGNRRRPSAAKDAPHQRMRTGDTAAGRRLRQRRGPASKRSSHDQSSPSTVAHTSIGMMAHRLEDVRRQDGTAHHMITRKTDSLEQRD